MRQRLVFVTRSWWVALVLVPAAALSTYAALQAPRLSGSPARVILFVIAVASTLGAVRALRGRRVVLDREEQTVALLAATVFGSRALARVRTSEVKAVVLRRTHLGDDTTYGVHLDLVDRAVDLDTKGSVRAIGVGGSSRDRVSLRSSAVVIAAFLGAPMREETVESARSRLFDSGGGLELDTTFVVGSPFVADPLAHREPAHHHARSDHHPTATDNNAGAGFFSGVLDTLGITVGASSDSGHSGDSTWDGGNDSGGDSGGGDSGGGD